ncbi:MAG: cytochrome c oxidase subunit 3 family protein [Armatimonadetes bacterium]|nr:cytochrome c oxidase subunit 3 family protein [Armatimonadota bacterium]
MANHAAEREAVVYEQYETISQQQETYIVGMWTFVVTEIMFFGAMFLAYTLYRSQYSEVWAAMSDHLDFVLGGINTTVLLVSSFFIAMAVHKAQLGKTRAQINYLVGTIGCAVIFLVIKYFEYSDKISHGLLPNWSYVGLPGVELGPSKIFMSLYFSMTGLHGLHVLLGIVAMVWLIILIKRKSEVITDYIPTEMFGLYWHFVDLVWIFLYPLYYLIPLGGK